MNNGVEEHASILSCWVIALAVALGGWALDWDHVSYVCAYSFMAAARLAQLLIAIQRSN